MKIPEELFGHDYRAAVNSLPAPGIPAHHLAAELIARCGAESNQLVAAIAYLLERHESCGPEIAAHYAHRAAWPIAAPTKRDAEFIQSFAGAADRALTNAPQSAIGNPQSEIPCAGAGVVQKGEKE